MKNEIFKTELDFIKSKGIRKFTEIALDNLPEYFWHVPASSSGRYHPPYALGDGGLVRHTIAAVNIAETLMGLDQYQKLLCENWHDCVIAALLLHDGLKQGKDGASGHTTKHHPLDCAEWVKNDKIFEKVIAKKDQDLISDLIKTHMGEWDADNNFPGTTLQKFVHMCDYLASRKNLIYEFGDRVTTIDGKSVMNECVNNEPEDEIIDPEKIVFNFGKHKGKSVSEIAKSNKDYIRWGLENLERIDPKMKKAMQMVME